MIYIQYNLHTTVHLLYTKPGYISISSTSSLIKHTIQPPSHLANKQASPLRTTPSIPPPLHKPLNPHPNPILTRLFSTNIRLEAIF